MKGLGVFYPGKDDPPSLPLLYRGRKVEVKVGNVPIADLLEMNVPTEGVPRGATKVLAGMAIGENGEVVDCVLLPPQTDTTGSNHEIDWGARLATAQELFKAQNSKTESIA